MSLYTISDKNVRKLQKKMGLKWMKLMEKQAVQMENLENSCSLFAKAEIIIL